MIGMRALATALIVLGLASALTNGAAVALSREIGAIQAAVAIAYGIAGIIAGALVWRRAPGARAAYLAWCATILLYLATVPELFVWYSVPAFLVAALILAWGYRYISRNVEAPGSFEGRGAVG